MGVWKVVGDTLFHFGDQTSIAGLNNVCHRKSFGKKVYWSFLFAVFLAATIYSVFDNIKTYLDYGIVTSTDLSHKTSVIFPAVSICNVNRVHCTNLFEETVVQQERLERLLKNETENATLGDIETTNRTFAVLDKLFVTSGCKQQICDQCSVTEVVPMEFVKSTFYCLQARAEINCIDTPQQVSPKECFWLLMMAENGTNLDFLKHFDMVIEDLQEINEAIDKYKCKDPNKLKDICQLQVPASGQSQVGKDQQQGQFIKLNICPSIPNPPGPPAKGQVTTQRKKRQIAPNPPGSGPSGSGPSGPSGPLGPRPGTDEDFEKNAEFLKLFMTLDPITRARIGHRIGSRESTLLQKNISSFITRCSYKGGTCDGDEFWFPFSTAEFGNCFTFNYDRNYADRRRYRKTTLTGTSYGLSVEIFLDQTNYMLNKLSKKAGARIVIHDPANPPLPDEYGMDLRPNTASSIAVQLTNITRLEAPFISNCTLGWNQTGYDNINTTIRYTLASCQRYCVQKSIVDECQCFHPNLVQSKIDSDDFRFVPPCLITPSVNNTDFQCFDTIFNQYDRQEKNCSCNPACSEFDFTSQISSSTWPSNQYWEDMAVQDLKILTSTDLKGPKHKLAETKTLIQEDYTRADVYYQTLNVQSIEQNEAYPGSDLVPGLGGALSLYLGIAIVMAFEVLELIWDLITNIFRHLNK